MEENIRGNKLISALLTHWSGFMWHSQMNVSHPQSMWKKYRPELPFSLVQVRREGVTVHLVYQRGHCPPQSV